MKYSIFLLVSLGSKKCITLNTKKKHWLYIIYILKNVIPLSFYALLFFSSPLWFVLSAVSSSQALLLSHFCLTCCSTCVSKAKLVFISRSYPEKCPILHIKGVSVVFLCDVWCSLLQYHITNQWKGLWFATINWPLVISRVTFVSGVQWGNSHILTI